MSRAWTLATARVALAAMLALTLLPSIGRIAQGRHGAATTVEGMRCDDAGANPHHRRGHAMPGGGDCSYCPLLAGLAPTDMRALRVPAMRASAERSVAAIAGAARAFRGNGLGARGPPHVG
jgi:hypothetical protein